MAISIDFPMFDMTNKLSKSADALDLALAQMGKKTVSPFAISLDSADDMFSSPVSAAAGSGFDEWLAADLQFGNLSGDESILSSSPLSSSSSSPFSGLDDSPLLGFESFNSASSLMGAPLFDISIIPPVMVDVLPVPVPTAIATPALTSAAVQQAAAALNIPWSHDLEKAVMAQAQADISTAAAQTVSSPVHVIHEDDIADYDFSRESSREASPSPAPTSTEPSSPSPASAAPTAPGKKKSKKRVLTSEEKMDEIVAKRAKNTDAARRSRLKKLIRLEGLEAKVSDLETANSDLSMKIAILETEKSGFVSKEAEQIARIEQLEAQLAEAHTALSKSA
ncbi:hypothetical protein BGZ82_008217 [Podila clonocystis]|nr:hypothetical protein BGZ82_008217 [Podila clonocystis]